jgi:L-ascorbate metabolism protein UlaG (beta-lactamase superfamily)
MQISHLGHAAVLVETDRTRILIDPGNLEPAWHGLTDLDAVLVTHVHPDHLDPVAAAELLAANERAAVYVEPSITEAGLPFADRLTPLPVGTTVTVGEFGIEGVGGQHAEVHRDVPRIGNVGLVFRAEGEPTLFHPGDSYATAAEGVDILAMPIYGPWAAMKETVDFVRAVGAAHGFAIHDELLHDRGRGLISGVVGNLTSTVLADLRDHKPYTF